MKKLIISTLLLSLWFTACKNPESKIDSKLVTNPTNANGEIDKSKLPVMTFESKYHDFGDIKEGEKVSFSFKFTNTGKGPLVISHASGSCGCTIPKYPEEPIEVGQSNYIDVQFDSKDKNGLQEKTVFLLCNTIPGEQQIHIKANVK